MDASPLILFNGIGRLDLLRLDDLPILVPEAVLIEIATSVTDVTTIRAVRSLHRLRVVDTARNLIIESGSGRSFGSGGGVETRGI